MTLLKRPASSDSRRGGAYIRYSSIMQKDSFSLEAQERQIRERARLERVEIVKVFSDPAQSAYSKRRRPGIETMLGAARRGEFDVLYIHKVDRLARRIKWALEIVEELSASGVTVKAVEQNFDLSTPEGKLIFNFLGSLGEFYSDNLSQETHKGKRERALSGFHNSAVPFGYHAERVGEKKTAVLIPELEPVLQGMFERYSSGAYSDQQIADWLNAQGQRTQHGRLFTKETVRAMLQNPFYAGQVRYRGTRRAGQDYRNMRGERVDGKHEAVISMELFKHCQAIRAGRQRKARRRPVTRRVYYLNGIIVCARCGRRLRAQSSYQGSRYYREVSRERGFEDCPLAGSSVDAALVDGQAAHLIQTLILPTDWERELQRLLCEEKTGPDPEAERARLRTELRRLRDNYEHSLYADEEHVYWHKVEQIQSQLATLESIPHAEVISAGKMLVSLKAAWELATESERHDLVQMILDEVGCNVEQGQIAWVRPRAGLEVLFQLVRALEPADELGRYRITWLTEKASTTRAKQRKMR